MPMHPKFIEEVETTVQKIQPDVLVRGIACFRRLGHANCSIEKFCAFMWTLDESAFIIQTAETIVPGIKTHALPQGFQAERVVSYLLEHLPGILDSIQRDVA